MRVPPKRTSYLTPLGFGGNIGVGFGNIGVGFGSIGVGFGFRADGGGNIAVGFVGSPAAGDTGEAEGVDELWGVAVANEALAACCFLSCSFWNKKRQPTPKNRVQKMICLITGGHVATIEPKLRRRRRWLIREEQRLSPHFLRKYASY